MLLSRAVGLTRPLAMLRCLPHGSVRPNMLLASFRFTRCFKARQSVWWSGRLLRPMSASQSEQSRSNASMPR